MTSMLLEDDDSLLNFLAMETLPPLSPTLEQALLEMIGDEDISREETVSFTNESSPIGTWEVASLALTPALQHKLTSNNPSETVGIWEEDTPEAKRARRSAIEKKSRQQRQSVLRRMRREVQHLQRVYDEVIRRQEAGDGTVASISTLQHKYSQLSLVTQALGEDRVKMLKLLESHDVFQRTAEAMATRGDERRDPDKERDNQLVWDTGVPWSSSFNVQIPQRSPAECYELVRETYETIKSFDEGRNFVSTRANFMGWTDKRKLDEAQALQYAFTKTFPLESAEGLMLRTWDVFSHADTMAKMCFNSSVATRFEVVQTLGDDLCIIRRDHKFPNMPIKFVTVHIVFRLQTPTGFTLCVRAIPAPEVKNALEPHEVFYDVLNWTHFNQLLDSDGEPAGCEITTGGYVVDVKQLVSKYWLFELILSVIRWENMCVAPLFLKL